MTLLLPFDLATFQHDDVVQLAQWLIGKKVCTLKQGVLTSGMIVETEAYKAPEDKASHAYKLRRTKRNEVMYQAGGLAYVYLCYGMHHLVNVVTGPAELPHAVLIRAIEPLDGIETMLERRKMSRLQANLTNGPGKLSEALGITQQDNGVHLLHSTQLWLEEYTRFAPEELIASARVGINYAEEYVTKPWRYRLRNNVFIGK